MRKGLSLALIVLALWIFGASEAGPESAKELFSLLLVPGVTFPLGEDANYFLPGGSAALTARLLVPDFPYLYFEAGAGYGITPVRIAPDSSYSNALLNLVGGRIGVGFRLPLAARLFAGASAHGGYYYGFLNLDSPDNAGRNPFFDAGLELKYRLTPHLHLGVDASYRRFFGLANDLLLGLGVSYVFPYGQKGTLPGARPNPQLELLNVSFTEVFPVFYKYFSDHSLGKLELSNKGKIPLEAVKVEVFVNQYMDNPYVCAEIPFLTGGGRQVVDLFALFNDRVLGITENTKVQISIVVESRMAGEGYTNELIENLRVYDRNAMTWEDDRRAAAFVSVKDPSVLRFSKNISSYVKDKASRSLNGNMLVALAFFEALKLHGLSYVVDPNTPFIEFSKNKSAVDFLQFPNQTLDYKAGDCDDLSILYCALLESVGIKSAFLTTPGHIFVAVSLDSAPAEARRQFADPDSFIYQGEDTWLPVEITALNRGFLDAWQAGSQLWKEQERRNQAAMIVLRDAWRMYEPVGFTGETPSIALPDENQVVDAFQREVRKFIDRDLYPQTRKLEEQISAEPKNVTLVNRLGVLYARYGIYDKAQAAFQRALKVQAYAPALVNLGNLQRLGKNLPEARRYYEMAYARAPKESTILLNLAMVNYELGQYAEAEAYYGRLRAQDRQLADRYAYLSSKEEGEGSRAASVEALQGTLIWGE